MKKFCHLLLLPIFFCSIANASPVTTSSPPEPGATFQSMWIDYGTRVDGRLGMTMHIGLTVYGMKDVLGQLTCYFRYADGKPDSWIRHRQGADRYHSPDGSLAAFENLTPQYDAAEFSDVQIFFPYDQFGLDAGTWDITIDVQYKAVSGATIAWLKTYDIEFTSYGTSRGTNDPASVAKKKATLASDPRAVLDSAWVDYDVRQDGELGMRLHFKFSTYNLKDRAALVAVYFFYNDAKSTNLKDRNGNFASASGNVAAYYDIKPNYDEAIYDDVQIFMPYSELELAPGKYELGMESKLIYSEGGLISNFTYKGFRYTQP